MTLQQRIKKKKKMNIQVKFQKERFKNHKFRTQENLRSNIFKTNCTIVFKTHLEFGWAHLTKESQKYQTIDSNDLL